MNLEEKTVKSNVVFGGHIIKVHCDDALRADGKPCTREYIEHPGGACVLFVKEGKILLVRQYRYAYREETLEIPAGKLNPGEEPGATAARELEEETGYLAARVVHMYTMYPTPGYTNEKIYIYRAYAAEEGESHPDEGEFVSARFYPVSEVREMIERGEIKDAKTIIAVFSYLLSEQNSACNAE